MKCPYCSQDAKWVPNEDVYGVRYGKSYMCYFCKPCDAYVGCHNNTEVPLGTMANKELRQWRRQIHNLIDPLWKQKQFSRGYIYSVLSEFYGKQIHVGETTVDQCRQMVRDFPVIEEKILGEK